jgi:CheY-like chemotaxis protein
MDISAKKVLIVDDSAQIRNILRDGFQAAGFSVCSEAANGAEALAEANKHRPDLIVLDQSMPVMTGLEAAPHLRKMLPNTPIVLFTFYGNEVSSDHAQSAGITSIVTKPNLDELISKAELHLNNKPGSVNPQKGATHAVLGESKKRAKGSAGSGR